MRFWLALALIGAGAASAAELPSRGTRPAAKPPEKPRRCEIDGVEGYLLANGTCVRISGALTFGVQGGNLK